MRQQQAMAVMMSGANVFLTGAPGAGKTYVLNRFVQRAERAGKRVAVTASTGIAASHLGGTTIHSWSGLGILDELHPEDLKRLGGSDRLIKRYNATDILVIDEVSMLHGRRLDMVNELAKLLRSSEAPFGGLQVVLVGDLFQLPPISRNGAPADFVHLSQAWAELDPRICYLTEQHRQMEQDALLDLLTAMRAGEVSELHETMLNDRLERPAPPSGSVTRLFSHNVDVDTINDRHLADISGPAKTFTMQTKGGRAKIEQLAKGVLAPEELELKAGAEVMFVANDFGAGFVNGSRGQVIDFKDALPLVQLAHNGRIIKVEPHSWSLNEDGRMRAEVSQLPLRLAWAITIHKSQGMSLDGAEIDLSRAFTPGMGYVALSRVRSLDGLYLKGLNNMALVMHPQIHQFDGELRRYSDQLAAATEDIAEEVIQPVKDVSADFDPVLFDKLKDWRLQRSRADKVAPFIIAHNTALQAVATALPATPKALLALPGFGARKVEAYGDDIIAVVAAHAAGKR